MPLIERERERAPPTPTRSKTSPRKSRKEGDFFLLSAREGTLGPSPPPPSAICFNTHSLGSTPKHPLSGLGRGKLGGILLEISIPNCRDSERLSPIVENLSGDVGILLHLLLERY